MLITCREIIKLIFKLDLDLNVYFEWFLMFISKVYLERERISLNVQWFNVYFECLNVITIVILNDLKRSMI